MKQNFSVSPHVYCSVRSSTTFPIRGTAGGLPSEVFYRKNINKTQFTDMFLANALEKDQIQNPT